LIKSGGKSAASMAFPSSQSTGNCHDKIGFPDRVIEIEHSGRSSKNGNSEGRIIRIAIELSSPVLGVVVPAARVIQAIHRGEAQSSRMVQSLLTRQVQPVQERLYFPVLDLHGVLPPMISTILCLPIRSWQSMRIRSRRARIWIRISKCLWRE
jgi:hypothetical protein